MWKPTCGSIYTSAINPHSRLMERRPDFRLETPEPVMITPFESGVVQSGQLLASSGDDVQLQLDEVLAVGSLLKLETGETWMLAEVMDCQQSPDGFRAGLTLLNWINKSELRRIFRDGGFEEASRHVIPGEIAA